MKSRTIIPALLVCFGVALSGCEWLTEKVAFDAIPRATFTDKRTVIGEAKEKNSFKVTDQIILSYADDVQKFMRLRMSGKRALRKVSASIQVVTAAIAAALAGFGGSAAVIAGFAGVSAIIPEFQGIFQAKGGAEAFRHGAELIGDAETDYLSEISKKGGQVQNALTPDGAALYKRVVASIVLVEKALLQQIPSRKEVLAADKADKKDKKDKPAKGQEAGKRTGDDGGGNKGGSANSQPESSATPSERPPVEITPPSR